MRDAVEALKQEIADCINSESRLMASTLSVHKGNSHSDTMAVFYRHRPEELLTYEYRSLVVELYIEEGRMSVRTHRCRLGKERRSPRRSAEIHISEEPQSQMHPIGDPQEFLIDLFCDDPSRVLGWVLDRACEWLLPRLEFKSA